MAASSEYVQIHFNSPAKLHCHPRALYPIDCGDWVRLAPRRVTAGAARLFLASFYGFIGAALGAGIFYAVLAFTGRQLGFVAVIVGLLVGKAVDFGAGGRGGLRYQVVAVLLTYCAIVTTYIPFIMAEGGNMTQRHLLEGRIGTLDDPLDYVAVRSDVTRRADADVSGVSKSVATFSGNAIHHIATWFAQQPRQLRVVGGFVVLFLIAASSPILAATNSFLTFLVIVVGIWEAWKINRRHSVILSAGPV